MTNVSLGNKNLPIVKHFHTKMAACLPFVKMIKDKDAENFIEILDKEYIYTKQYYEKIFKEDIIKEVYGSLLKLVKLISTANIDSLKSFLVLKPFSTSNFELVKKVGITLSAVHFDEYSLLELAVKTGSVEIIEELIKLGCSFSFFNNRKQCLNVDAINMLIFHRHMHVIEYLETLPDYSLFQHCFTLRRFINVIFDSEKHALYDAPALNIVTSKYSKLNLIKYLIETKRIEIGNPADYLADLIYNRKDTLPIIQYLYEKGVNMNNLIRKVFCCCEKHYDTPDLPLNMAIRQDRNDIINYFISIGVKVDLKGADDLSPLELAKTLKKKKLYKMLMQAREKNKEIPKDELDIEEMEML